MLVLSLGVGCGHIYGTVQISPRGIRETDKGAATWKNIRNIAVDILCADGGFGSIFPAFGCGLPELLAEFVQFTGGMGTVGIVITGQEDLFSLVEDVICNIHCGSN